MARSPGGFSVSQYLSTDQRKSYSLTGNFSYAMNNRGGWGVFPGFGVTVRPTPAVEVSFNPTYRRSFAVAQYVRSVQDPLAEETYGARYVFSDLDQKVISMDTRVSWTFTPRMSLQLFLQPLISSGTYSGFNELRQPM